MNKLKAGDLVCLRRGIDATVYELVEISSTGYTASIREAGRRNAVIQTADTAFLRRATPEQLKHNEVTP